MKIPDSREVSLAETMLIAETPLVSLIPDLGSFGVKCTGLVLFVGVDKSEAIELSEKCGENYSSSVLSLSVVTTLRSHRALLDVVENSLEVFKDEHVAVLSVSIAPACHGREEFRWFQKISE